MPLLRRLAPWPFALFIAYVFLWYLQYKWTGDAGSVQLFDVLSTWLGAPGIEPYFRIGTGIAEFIAAILVLIPRTQFLGGAGAIAIMSGAMFFHLASPLGIDPYGDGGVLFKEAVGVFCSGWIVLALRWRDAMAFLRALLGVQPSAAAKRAA